MYYQLMEEDGYVRNDSFDGSIPFPDNDKILESMRLRKYKILRQEHYADQN